MIGPVKAVKYELAVPADDGWLSGAWTAWIDPTTDRPVRLRYQKDETRYWLLDGFVWNEPIAASAFDLTPPAGWTVEAWPVGGEEEGLKRGHPPRVGGRCYPSSARAAVGWPRPAGVRLDGHDDHPVRLDPVREYERARVPKAVGVVRP